MYKENKFKVMRYDSDEMRKIYKVPTLVFKEPPFFSIHTQANWDKVHILCLNCEKARK